MPAWNSVLMLDMLKFNYQERSWIKLLPGKIEEILIKF